MPDDVFDTTETLVINLFGGPCSGKSTLAAQLFSSLKARGVSCEYNVEYAKRKTWERSLFMLQDQFYVSAKQHHELLMASQGCSVIVTDSPLILGAAYMSPRDAESGLADTLCQYSRLFKNFNVFLDRSTLKYDTVGRNQEYTEAIALDRRILQILHDYPIMAGCPWTNAEGIAMVLTNNKTPPELAAHVINTLSTYGVIL